MTCGWKLEHQPRRAPWKVPRRRVWWRARHVATIGVVTSENSVEPFPLQAPLRETRVAPCQRRWLCLSVFCWKVKHPVARSRPRLGKGLMQEEEARFLTGPQSSVDIPLARSPSVVRRAKASGTQCKK